MLKTNLNGRTVSDLSTKHFEGNLGFKLISLMMAYFQWRYMRHPKTLFSTEFPDMYSHALIT